MIKDKIKFAVVGCGHIGKRHAEMISLNSEAELVALCDILPKNELAIDKYDVPFFNDITELLDANLNIDVISICTPNGLHIEQSLKGLDARKHVVCEKPMGLTKSACETVIFKSLQVSRQVFCVMQNRYSPPAKLLKNIIDEKIIGDIYHVQVNCFWNRDARYYKKGNWKGTKDLDGGTLFTQFSHFIDIMYWLFGDITNIKAHFYDNNHAELTEFEDTGNVIFDFLNGGSGLLTYSTSIWDSNFESSITVIGSNGTIKVGGQYMNEVQYCKIKDFTLPKLE